jgi:hypothetical protein
MNSEQLNHVANTCLPAADFYFKNDTRWLVAGILPRRADRPTKEREADGFPINR